jgi:hypothetical protein
MVVEGAKTMAITAIRRSVAIETLGSSELLYHFGSRAYAAYEGYANGGVVGSVIDSLNVGNPLNDLSTMGANLHLAIDSENPEKIGAASLPVAMAVVGAAVGRFGGAPKGGPGPVLRGAAGVEQAIVDLKASGVNILGREITLEVGGFRIRPDLFVELPNGQKAFLEIKTGPFAKLTANQLRGIDQVWKGGAIPRGLNALRAKLPVGKPLPATPVWTIHYPWPLP